MKSDKQFFLLTFKIGTFFFKQILAIINYNISLIFNPLKNKRILLN